MLAKSLTALVALVATSSIAAADPRFGAMLDIGVPDGATASVVYRPTDKLRLAAGVGDNMISHSIRGEISYRPLRTWMSPSLTLDYGRFAEGNANPLVRMVTGNAAFSSPMLDRVGYDFVNAHVGIELGRSWFTFYAHAGMSYVTGSVHNIDAVASNAALTFDSDPHVKAWTASARIGLVFYFAK